jgi:chemotaxis protein CheZ
MGMSVRENKVYLASAQELVECLQRGDTAEVERIIDDITHIRETALFKELGMLTRELHDSLKNFKLDGRLSQITDSEIPDARERLNHVLTMTEQAAHRTLNAIEGSMPEVDELNAQAQALKADWQRFRQRKMSAAEFRDLSKRLDDFLAVVDAKAGKLQSNLTEALMAQDFQDLTGQIIRRVISLVQEVEENLVQLVRISGQRIGTDEKPKAADNQKDTMMKGQGPHIPGQQDAEFVQGQDDVDDLLSSLGF